MEKMLNLYKFQEGSTIENHIYLIRYVSTTKKITDENVKNFAQAAGGKKHLYTELTKGEEIDELTQGIELFDRGNRHYSLVQFLGEISYNEADHLRKLKILDISLEDIF